MASSAPANDTLLRAHNLLEGMYAPTRLFHEPDECDNVVAIRPIYIIKVNTEQHIYRVITVTDKNVDQYTRPLSCIKNDKRQTTCTLD